MRNWDIKIIDDYDDKQKISRKILEALPDWFGIEDARESYIKESADQLFFAAFDKNHAIGFFMFERNG